RHVADADLLQVLLDDVRDEPHARDVYNFDDWGVGRHEGAGVGRAPRHEAVHRRDDQRVLQVDAQLVEPRLRLVVLRPRQVERCLRRLVLRFRVVERLLRKQLPLKEVARALDVGLREIEVGLALADGRLGDLERRLGLLDLFANLLVLDPGDALGTTDTVWSPIRLPTTASSRSTSAWTTGASSTVSWPRPPPRAPPPWRPAGAPPGAACWAS